MEHKDVIDEYTLRNNHNHELLRKFTSYQINIARLSELWYKKRKV